MRSCLQLEVKEPSAFRWDLDAQSWASLAIEMIVENKDYNLIIVQFN